MKAAPTKAAAKTPKATPQTAEKPARKKVTAKSPALSAAITRDFHARRGRKAARQASQANQGRSPLSRLAPPPPPPVSHSQTARSLAMTLLGPVQGSRVRILVSRESPLGSFVRDEVFFLKSKGPRGWTIIQPGAVLEDGRPVDRVCSGVPSMYLQVLAA